MSGNAKAEVETWNCSSQRLPKIIPTSELHHRKLFPRTTRRRSLLPSDSARDHRRSNWVFRAGAVLRGSNERHLHGSRSSRCKGRLHLRFPRKMSANEGRWIFHDALLFPQRLAKGELLFLQYRQVTQSLGSSRAFINDVKMIKKKFFEKNFKNVWRTLKSLY